MTVVDDLSCDFRFRPLMSSVSLSVLPGHCASRKLCEDAAAGYSGTGIKSGYHGLAAGLSRG